GWTAGPSWAWSCPAGWPTSWWGGRADGHAPAAGGARVGRAGADGPGGPGRGRRRARGRRPPLPGGDGWRPALHGVQAEGELVLPAPRPRRPGGRRRGPRGAG